jgi:DNA-binding protein HU-beta
MNKSELVNAISTKTKISRTKVESWLDVTLEIIQKTVSKGEEVKLVGFGSFQKTQRKAKTGRNPKTGETHRIPETSVPRFKPGKEFKNLVK